MSQRPSRPAIKVSLIASVNLRPILVGLEIMIHLKVTQQRITLYNVTIVMGFNNSVCGIRDAYRYEIIHILDH
jgi:hypothetical protein